MRVLVAPAAYRGSLTAGQAAEVLAAGWRAGAPHDDVAVLPLSDGGEGLLDVLAAAGAVQTVATTVTGPWGEPVPAEIGVREVEGRVEAWVEAAQAAGRALEPAAGAPVVTASSYGVGELVREAVATGAERVVVGVRDLACHDGGLGLWQALAGRPPSPLETVLSSLREGETLTWLRAARQALAEVEVTVATPEDLPLLGLQGASATLADDRGLPVLETQQLEGLLGELVEHVRRVLPERQDLLSGRPRRLDKVPGAGSGGGVAYGLLVLGAHLTAATPLVAATVGLPEAIAGADLVVTGEGRLDWTSLRGRVVATVGEAAVQQALPVVVIPGQSVVGRRETAAIGVTGIYPVAESLTQVPAVLADPAGSLARRASRVARTWSPAR